MNFFTKIVLLSFIVFSSRVISQELKIISFSPYFNQSVDSSQSLIEITFNTKIDTGALKNNIILFSEYGASKRYNYSYNDTTSTIKIRPLNPYFVGEKVTVTLTKNLKGKGSESFDGFVWSFIIKPSLETAPNFSSPQILNEYTGIHIKSININMLILKTIHPLVNHY